MSESNENESWMAQAGVETNHYSGSRTESREDLNDIRLDDNSPLYHVFLNPSEEGVVDHDNAKMARNRVKELTKIDPDKVKECNGKTAIEALEILESIETN